MQNNAFSSRSNPEHYSFFKKALFLDNKSWNKFLRSDTSTYVHFAHLKSHLSNKIFLSEEEVVKIGTRCSKHFASQKKICSNTNLSMDIEVLMRYTLFVFLGSSVVEHAAVNRQVAGSNPARGAFSFSYVDTFSIFFSGIAFSVCSLGL